MWFGPAKGVRHAAAKPEPWSVMNVRDDLIKIHNSKDTRSDMNISSCWASSCNLTHEFSITLISPALLHCLDNSHLSN